MWANKSTHKVIFLAVIFVDNEKLKSFKFRTVAELYPKGGFPLGEIQPHGKTRYPDPHSRFARITEEEKRWNSMQLSSLT